MIILKKNSFTIIDSDGKEKEYTVLFTFENEKTNKNYIAYTDNSKNKDGKIMVHASIYNPNNLEEKFKQINTDEEWEAIHKIFKKITEEESDMNDK